MKEGSTMERPPLPRAQLYYGEIVYWICLVSALICTIGPVIAMANIDNNVMNPHKLFTLIWEGNNAEAVWQHAAGGFLGGHFYLDNFTKGDGFTQFGIALGCACALPALLFAGFLGYLRERPRAWLWFAMSVWVAFMISYSMIYGGPAH